MSGQCLSPDVAGRALTPATRHRLGRPLPHQQADRTWADQRPKGPEGSPSLIRKPGDLRMLSGITGTFAKAPCGAPLSLCTRYVTHALLTRSPLTLLPLPSTRSVRLACLSHAASVRSEPGSNSSLYYRCIRQIQNRPKDRLQTRWSRRGN